jgi:hypothetical protein
MSAARVAAFTAAGRRADELRHAIDPAAMPATTCEWTTRLVGSLGCIASSMTDDDLEASLVDLLADALLWAEDLERERRAA